MKKKQKRNLIRIIASAVSTTALVVLKGLMPQVVTVLGGYLYMALFVSVYVLIGHDILRKAFRGILNGRVLDENFLMAVATLGAFALAVYEKSSDYLEAVAVMLFYQTGEFFQGLAVGKSRQNIAALMDIRPDYANVEEDGNIVRKDPSEIEVGTVIIVKTGEKVPIDGLVEKGSCSLDTRALTGESVPSQVREGDEVLSGTVNLDGVLEIRTTKPFGESAVSRILELVESSSSRKSRSEAFISKFARVYTPCVCIAALLLASVVPLFNILVLRQPSMFSSWLYRALTFLVISCPCALVISIPLSFFAGLGCASHEGILIKGSNYLETLSKVRTVVFDKTGTLTKGVFEVAQIHSDDIEPDELLRIGAHCEAFSSHPVALSIRRAYRKDLDLSLVRDAREISGKGVCAVFEGRSVCCGNERLMRDLGLEVGYSEDDRTCVHIAIDGVYRGFIAISDVVKEDSGEAVGKLRSEGIESLVMLTGDSEGVARKVAADLGLDYYHARMLPSDKVGAVESIIKGYENTSKKVAFVGDGINDAPVLIRSDIGIAMGGAGSDAAIEASDVVLMDDSPLKIAKAIAISRKCLSIVRQNIVFALTVKAICLVLGALGLAGMWLAVFSDVGVMVIAVLNAMRALRA